MPMLRGFGGMAPRKFLKIDVLRLHFRTLLVQLWQVQLLKDFTINNTVQYYGKAKLLVGWCDLSGKLGSNFFLLFFSVLNAMEIKDFELSPPHKHQPDKFMCLPLIMIDWNYKHQINFGLAIDYTDYTCVVTTEASYVQLPVGSSHH